MGRGRDTRKSFPRQNETTFLLDLWGCSVNEWVQSRWRCRIRSNGSKRPGRWIVVRWSLWEPFKASLPRYLQPGICRLSLRGQCPSSDIIKSYQDARAHPPTSVANRTRAIHRASGFEQTPNPAPRSRKLSLVGQVASLSSRPRRIWWS